MRPCRPAKRPDPRPLVSTTETPSGPPEGVLLCAAAGGSVAAHQFDQRLSIRGDPLLGEIRSAVGPELPHERSVLHQPKPDVRCPEAEAALRRDPLQNLMKHVGDPEMDAEGPASQQVPKRFRRQLGPDPLRRLDAQFTARLLDGLAHGRVSPLVGRR